MYCIRHDTGIIVGICGSEILVIVVVIHDSSPYTCLLFICYISV